MSQLNDNARVLLESLAERQKAFDIGRCPVQAVAIGWELCSLGLARIEGGVIAITQDGLRAINR